MTDSSTRTRVRLRPLGLPVVVDCETEELAERVRQDWSRCRPDDGDEPDDAETDALSVSLAEAENTAGALYVMTTRLTYRLIEGLMGSALMFHACGLSDQSGNVLILVAPSGTGKTTAASTLARSAFGYVTDETVAIRLDGLVEPYPKPLSVISTGPGPELKTQQGPDQLGLRHPPSTLRPARLVVLERSDDAMPPHLEPLSLVESMVEVMPQTSAILSLERPLQQLAALHDTCGGSFRLRYTEIAHAEGLLTELLAGPHEAPERWEGLGVAATDEGGPRFPLLDGRLTPVPFEDAVRTAEEALVLTGGVPMRLSGIGVTLWVASVRGVPPEGLVDVVIAEHGPHAEAERLVNEALTALQAAGMLLRRIPLTVAQVMAGESRDDSPPLAARVSATGPR